MRVHLLIPVLTLSCLLDSAYASRSAGPATPTARHQQIAELLGKLKPVTEGETWSYPSSETIRGTFRRLLTISRESRNARRTVIAALIKAFQEDPSDRRIYIAHLFTKLSALEGLDLIVQHLDHKGLFSSLSLNIRPMVDAVIGFGEAAVPYLERALSNERTLVRTEASIALGYIGGLRAKRVLEKALNKESDSSVIPSIRGGLGQLELTRLQSRRR